MSDISPDLTGHTLGNWILGRQLGEGGFGAVYEAQHATIGGRRAAVKVLHPHLAFHKDIKRRFITEASIASQADHDNIVQIFDGGVSADGICYVAMELLKGRSLAKCIHDERRLNVQRTLAIMNQVASALEAAHGLGVVHRDLKPDNIFIIQRNANPDFVKVLDFGIAKLQTQQSQTTTGTLLGTPLYMSPEQWQTLPDIDGRSDLYALGVIIYECLTGQPPYDGATSFALMMAHMQKPIPHFPQAVAVPEALRQLVHRLLAKKREERPSSAREVITELRRLASSPLDVSEQTVNVFAPTPMAAPSPYIARPSLSIRQQTGEMIRSAFSHHRLLLSALGAGAGLGTIALVWVLVHPAAKPAPAVSPATVADPLPAVASQGENVLPPELAVLGPGRFLMGWGSIKTRPESPAHLVDVGRFAIGLQEVSMVDYRAYTQAEHLSSPLPWDGVDDFAAIGNLPVNQVTRLQAAQYCKWRYGKWGGRLPTESEWEYAARNGGTTGQYPWPGMTAMSLVNYVNAGKKPVMLMPVDSMPEAANARGLQHILGNVAEWTQSDASVYPESSLRSLAGAVVRGGSAADSLESLSAPARTFRPAGSPSVFIGFRCVATPP